MLKNVTIESGTPMSAFGQSDGPLQGARVAALTLHRHERDAADHP